MKKRNKLDEQTRLENDWSNIAGLYIYGYTLDVEKMKHLIYDTYKYFWNKRNEPIERGDLCIYKYMGQFIKFSEFPNNVSQSCFYTITDFVAGLCVAIETGFECTYGKEAIQLGTESTGGGYRIEADMSSYENYEKEFDKDLNVFKESLDDYYEENVED